MDMIQRDGKPTEGLCGVWCKLVTKVNIESKRSINISFVSLSLDCMTITQPKHFSWFIQLNVNQNQASKNKTILDNHALKTKAMSIFYLRFFRVACSQTYLASWEIRFIIMHFKKTFGQCLIALFTKRCGRNEHRWQCTINSFCKHGFPLYTLLINALLRTGYHIWDCSVANGSSVYI